MKTKKDILVSPKMAQAMEECLNERWVPAIKTGKLGTIFCQLCQQAEREKSLIDSGIPESDCHYCPVYKATGAKLCKKTPYMKWNSLNFFYEKDYETYISKCKKAAEAEVDFLNSVKRRMRVDPDIAAINYKTNIATIFYLRG
jgi:hypothetical protein